MKKITLAAAVAVAMTSASAMAETTLRIQTHFSPETHNGKAAAKWVEDVQAMSGGDLAIEMFYSSSVVKSVETFDAAVNGILDCDMTGGSYQVGKDKAFQFTGDLMGGYSNPYQMLGWLLHNGGRDAVNELYNSYDMQFVGWWVPGQESLVWDKLSDANKRILEVSMEALALRIATETEIMNAKTAQELEAKGVNLYDWSSEDRAAYRAAVKDAWVEYADNDQAKALLQSHIDFLVDQGAMQ